MTIAEEFLEILREIRTKNPFPRIKEIFIPQYAGASPEKTSFGLIQLDGGAAGIIYLSLSPIFLEQAMDLDVRTLIGKDPFEIAQWLTDPKSNDLQKALALGTINAMSSNFFEQSGFPLDFATNSMGNLSLIETDHVGMVGYFLPLVKQIGDQQIPLTVIEKKKALVQSHPTWEVTLDPASLQKCNKIIITSTTILNDTLDDVLKYCAGAEFISVIGPTAGFIPDPLFKRGVHIVGGTKIHDPIQLRSNFEKGHRWGSSTRKYCIDKAQYAGYRVWLAKL